jgi:hypothetical protein
MDLSATRSSSTESIETQDIDNSASSHSLPVHQMDSANEQLEELTKQLNESKSAEKRANDERDKYIQMYNRTNERFLAFERKQLDQLRLILTMLTPDQHRFLSGKNKFLLFFISFSFSLDSQNDYRRPRRAFTSPSTSMLLPSSLNQPVEDSNNTIDYHKTEEDWNSLVSQVSYLVKLNKINYLFI